MRFSRELNGQPFPVEARGDGASQGKIAPRKPTIRGGYTLVEVVVAVVLVAIVATAFYGGLASGFGIVQSTREDLRATQILMQKLEGVRLCTWSQLTNFTFQEQYDPLGSTNQTGGVFYTGSVSNCPNTTIPNTAAYYDRIRLVTVSVGWTNFNGAKPVPHFRQMQSQVARYGLQNYIWGAIR